MTILKTHKKTKPLHCANGEGTVSFWLNTYGQDESQFNVYLRSAETQRRVEKFGPLVTSSKQAWRYHQFSFDLDTENFVAIFEFTCGGLKGDIALDDIRVTCGRDDNQERLIFIHLTPAGPTRKSCPVFSVESGTVCLSSSRWSST